MRSQGGTTAAGDTTGLRRRSRVRHLRAPFVVTVAVGAGAAACGGSVSDGGLTVNPPECVAEDCSEPGSGGAGSGGAGSGGGVARGGGENAGVGGCATDGCVLVDRCPLAIPVAQTPCNVSPEIACTVASSGACPAPTATCVDGLWQVEPPPPCNPPPPPVTTCPVTTPTDGDYCNVVPELLCEYGDCFGFPDTEARCIDSAWDIGLWSCNPPQFACPTTEPAQGAPCFAGEGTACEYGDCYGTPTGVASCMGGVWQVDSLICNPPPLPATDGGTATTDAGTGDGGS